MNEFLTGLIAAPHTPMNYDYSVNLDAIEKQAQLFEANDVRGVYICGSTGEGMSLTIQERIAVANRWQEVAGDNIKVVVNVGHTCLEDCKTLAIKAKEAGVFAISAMPPCYYKPANVEVLTDFYAQIALATPDVPFYAYNTPGLSGVNFSMVKFLEVAQDRIPNLRGIKYNHTDLMDYSQCRAFEGGKYDILFGVDEFLLASLPYSTQGAIGSTYNYAAPLYYSIIEAYNDGNMELANEYQLKSIEMIQVLLKYDVLPAGKAIMKLMGVDCGPVRLPVKNITENDFENLCSDLEQIGFFEYCSNSLVKV